jgi:two-component system chemotaxis response regulator CheY
MNGMSIMVVDDSQITAKKIRSLLEALGHTVVQTARDGKEAIARYQATRPDLVTMDITMPEMDGIEATRKIMAHDPYARIIVVTSHGQEEMVRGAMEAGAKGYLLKPFDQQKLRNVVDKVIRASMM